MQVKGNSCDSEKFFIDLELYSYTFSFVYYSLPVHTWFVHLLHSSGIFWKKTHSMYYLFI